MARVIEGIVNEHGVPVISLRLADRVWAAIVDTGFNGGLELPASLAGQIDAEYHGLVESRLAAGIVVNEEVFPVELDFDGRREFTPATFAEVQHVLVGTRLLRRHRLVVDFPARTVLLEREFPS
jgi:predicted aspartyl protease